MVVVSLTITSLLMKSGRSPGASTPASSFRRPKKPHRLPVGELDAPLLFSEHLP